LNSGALLNPTSPTNLAPTPWRIGLACAPGLNGNGGGANNNPNPQQCVGNVIPGERLLRNGAFKASSVRNIKFTGPYFHNGAKMDLEQVFDSYATAVYMTALNFNNLDTGLRIITLLAPEKAAVLEMMETGLTDWRVAYEEGKFDHPELFVPNGHDSVTGQTILAGIPAVGATGHPTKLLQTFADQLANVTANRAQTLTEPCTVPGLSVAGLSLIDVPPVVP
jgi:hypothetical protein